MIRLQTQMKTGLLTSLLLVTALPLFAQRYTQSDPAFAEVHNYAAAEGERVLKTWYHYVVTRQGLKYVVRQFFPETGKLTSLHTYQDRNLSILDGPFELRSDDGEAVTKGAYKENLLHGEWTTSTGQQPLITGAYDMGLRIGEWKEYFPGGQLKSSFTFDAGEELGPYVMYDTTGVILDTGNSILGERYTSLPPAEFEARRGRQIIDEFPCFGTCDENLSLSERTRLSGIAVSNYIQHNLQVPEVVGKYQISGRVNASVLIDENGHVADINIVNGLCQPIADECRRIINSMPAWQPGSKNGKPAPVRVLIPFAFAPQ